MTTRDPSARDGFVAGLERWITGEGELTEEQAAARLLVRVLPVLLPLFFLMSVASAIVAPAPVTPFGAAVGSVIGASSVGAYVLALRGRGRLAAHVMVWSGTVGALGVALVEPDPTRAVASVSFVLTGVLYAAYLLPFSATILASIAATLVTASLPLLHPAVSAKQAVIPVFFTAIISVLAIVGARIRTFQLETIRRRNEEVREREQRVRVLMDASPDAVVGVARDGRIVEWSRQAEETFGWSREQVLGHDFACWVLEPESHDLLRRALADADRSESGRGEGKARCRDGRVVPVELSVAAQALPEGPGYAVFLRDITERRRIQAELLLTDRMVTAGRLAAGVAHEINNPMTYVLSNLEFLRIQSQTSPEAAAIEPIVDEALEGARRVLGIVRNMRTFSRVEDDRAQAVDLRKVLDSAVQLAWNEIRHRARLVKRYDAVPLVVGSEGRLGQVFLNLMVNAAQAFTTSDLARNEIEVSVSVDAQGRVVGRVRDTGPGIPEEIRTRIFSPFFTTKPVGEGTGLGLWVARSIIAGLGGDITVDSEPGRGTTFSVILPTSDSVAAEPRAAPLVLRATPLAPLSILVIVDDLAVGKALRRILEGHEVTLASSGQEALHICAHRRFDLVLCDVMMPGLTGTEVAARLQREQAVPAERIVLMTGGAFTSSESLAVGRTDRFLEKPIDRARLENVLRAVAAGRDPFSPTH